MTGYDVYKSAVLKLGMNTENGTAEREAAFKAAAVDAINVIGDDLVKMKPIKDLLDEISIDEKGFTALSYGVAMMLSVLYADTERNVIMTAIYNARRSAYLSETKTVKDISPYSLEA